MEKPCGGSRNTYSPVQMGTEAKVIEHFKYRGENIIQLSIKMSVTTVARLISHHMGVGEGKRQPGEQEQEVREQRKQA
jgi:hypothetical protein